MHYDSAASCEAIHKFIGRAHDNGECETAWSKGFGFEVDTLAGPQRCFPGDYVAKNFDRGFRVIDKRVFELTHESLATTQTLLSEKIINAYWTTFDNDKPELRPEDSRRVEAAARHALNAVLDVLR